MEKKCVCGQHSAGTSDLSTKLIKFFLLEKKFQQRIFKHFFFQKSKMLINKFPFHYLTVQKLW